LEQFKEKFAAECQTKSPEKVLDHFLFSMKEKGSAEEYRDFLTLLHRVVEKSA
jgi:hypothetical protein